MLSPEQIATLKCIREGRELPNPFAHLPAWAGFVGQGTMSITTAGSAYLGLYEALETTRAELHRLQLTLEPAQPSTPFDVGPHEVLRMADELRRLDAEGNHPPNRPRMEALLGHMGRAAPHLAQALLAAQQHLAHPVAVVAPDRDYYPEERARLTADVQRLLAAAPSAPIVVQAPADAPFPICPVHGVVEADDDGCCPECARDCVVVADAASADVVEELGAAAVRYDELRATLAEVLGDLGFKGNVYPLGPEELATLEGLATIVRAWLDAAPGDDINDVKLVQMAQPPARPWPQMPWEDIEAALRDRPTLARACIQARAEVKHLQTSLNAAELQARQAEEQTARLTALLDEAAADGVKLSAAVTSANQQTVELEQQKKARTLISGGLAEAYSAVAQAIGFAPTDDADPADVVDRANALRRKADYAEACEGAADRAAADLEDEREEAARLQAEVARLLAERADLIAEQQAALDGLRAERDEARSALAEAQRVATAVDELGEKKP